MAFPHTVARASRRSSAEIGLAYENHSLAYLNTQLHMSLRRVGRAGDGGIDLRGSWWVPAGAISASASTSPHRAGSDDRQTAAKHAHTIGERQGFEPVARRIRVVGQCKAERKALGPRVVRELEGVVGGLKCECASSRSVGNEACR